MAVKFGKISTYKPGKNEEKHRREIDQDLSKLFQAITPAFGGGGVGGVPGGENTHVQYNRSGVFGGDVGFRYITGVSINIMENLKLIFSDSGDDEVPFDETYIKYNPSTDYFEFYVNDEIRVQM